MLLTSFARHSRGTFRSYRCSTHSAILAPGLLLRISTPFRFLPTTHSVLRGPVSGMLGIPCNASGIIKRRQLLPRPKSHTGKQACEFTEGYSVIAYVNNSILPQTQWAEDYNQDYASDYGLYLGA